MTDGAGRRSWNKDRAAAVAEPIRRRQKWRRKPKKQTARGRKQDRARVAGGEDYEVGYEAKKTGRPGSVMKNAAKKAGPSRSEWSGGWRVDCRFSLCFDVIEIHETGECPVAILRSRGMKNPMHDPDHWRERAEETRVKAEGFRVSKDQRESLLRIAEEYERLASCAEKWQSVEQSGSE